MECPLKGKGNTVEPNKQQKMKTIDDFDFKNKKALVRVDFNVPLNADFKVTDANRIEAAAPTIAKILKDGGSAVLMSHLGRPDGKRNDDMSLRYVCDAVSAVIGSKVKFVPECVGETAEKAVADLKPGEVLLLENLRFHVEVEKGNKEFAEQLSKLGSIYVDDAFGTAHRAYASTTIVSDFFPGQTCFLSLLPNYIEAFEKV